MSGPLILDSQINWQQIATIPGPVPGPLPDGYPSYGGGSNQSHLLLGAELNSVSTMVFVVDDDSIVALFHPIPRAAGVPDAYPYVVDSSGALTSFAAPHGVTGGTVQKVNSFGSGNFNLTDINGDPGTVVWYARFVNAKLNNPVPMVLPFGPLALVAPCGEPGPPKAYYDAVERTIAYGFYGTQGQSGGSISAQTYTVGPTGNQALSTEGPVGVWNSNSGQDDFDHSGSDPNATKSGMMSNGIFGQLDVFGNTCGTSSFLVDVGVEIQCGGQNKSGIQVRPRAGAIVYPLFTDFDSTSLLIDTNLPQVIGVLGENVQLFMPGLTAQISAVTAPAGSGAYSNWRLAITRKWIFAVWSQGPFNPGTGNLVYRTALPAGLIPAPAGVIEAHHFAANYARPISLTGRYKA